MTSPTAEPADTTMMRIVHDALRRDLVRASIVLDRPDVASEQLRAVAEHLVWMMRFLRAHHGSEDDGLYPLTLERVGDDLDARAVLDRMRASHDEIADAVVLVERSARALSESASNRDARLTGDALANLGRVLIPHLEEEERDAMPIVARLLTHSEWMAIEQEYNLDPKSTAQLALEGHWLIDGASAADRATVLGLVPPVQRALLLAGYAARYRRRARACWGRLPRQPARVQLENQVAVTVDADIDAVWEVVRDVTRVGEWSDECGGAEWLGDACAPVSGARFRGRNRSGVFRWGRVCEIVSAEPYELVWVTVPTTLYPDSSEWRIRLVSLASGTEVSQQFRVVRTPKMLVRFYAVLVPAHRDRTAALTADLERLGAVAARMRVST